MPKKQTIKPSKIGLFPICQVCGVIGDTNIMLQNAGNFYAHQGWEIGTHYLSNYHEKMPYMLGTAICPECIAAINKLYPLKKKGNTMKTKSSANGRLTYMLIVAIGILILLIPLTAKMKTSDERWLYAIRMKESSNGLNLVGDKGKSIGPYQISEAYWLDSKTTGSWTDCMDRSYSEKVMQNYWKRYCPKAWESRDWKTLCRIHNGGPKGDTKKATEKYFDEVLKIYDLYVIMSGRGVGRT